MQHFGNYRGIVLKTDDPDNAGHVKVWVPAVHKEIFTKDIADDKAANGASTPTSVLGFSKTLVDKITENLPWASIAQPLMGGGSSYGYNGQQSYGDGVPFYSGTISVGANGKVNKEELRGFLLEAVKGSKLNGFSPEDGATFGVDGSAESWANYFYKMAQYESTYDVNATNLTDAGGSWGIFQVSTKDGKRYGANPTGQDWTVAELRDPVNNANTAIAIHARNVLQLGRILNNKGQGAGRVLIVKTQNDFGYYATNTMSKMSRDFRSGNWPSNNFPASSVELVSSQKPAQTFSGDQKPYRVISQTRDEYGAEKLKAEGVPISLDYDSLKGDVRHPLVVIPNPNEYPEIVYNQILEHANSYVALLATFFESKGADPKTYDKPTVVTRSENRNGAGKAKFLHTEPFNAAVSSDGGDLIVKYGQEYADILASTLGKIPNAIFIAPHTKGAGGTADYNGKFETAFAREHIIPFLGGANVTTTCDAFGAVGPTHPEETRDRQFLEGYTTKGDGIEAIVQNGKEIFELRQKQKGGESVDDELKLKRDYRQTLWDAVELDSKDSTELANFAKVKADYVSKDLDYTEPPVNSKVNPGSCSMAHTPYSNVSRGAFSIPEMGAPVWVFFEGGEIDFPVVFANNPKAQDYASIYDITSNAPDSPASDSNGSLGTNITRGKTVINNRGGSLEYVNTTGRERVKLTSYHGSSYDMNQLGTGEFVVGNKTQLVKGDKFTTVRGDESVWTDGQQEIIVKGDQVLKCGNVKGDHDIAKKMKELHQPIHDKIQLFDIKRAAKGHPLDTSPIQEQSGTTATCPVCSGTKKHKVRTNKPSTFKDAKIQGGKGKSEKIDGGSSTIDERTEDIDVCSNCHGTGEVPWSGEGDFVKDIRKSEIPTDINNASAEMSSLENRLSSGGNVTRYITRSKTEFIGTTMNDLNSVRVDVKGKRTLIGQSPSKNGKGVFPTYAATPLVEHVATSGLAGGDYDLMVSNKYSLLVGANGINMKTLGQYNMQGRILTIAGDMVSISSNNEVSIDGGRVTKITGDHVEISPRNQTVGDKTYKSIALNGSLSTSANQVVKGGVHVEGELSAQHITAPVEFQQTETTLSLGSLVTDVLIGRTSDGKKVYSVAAKDAVVSAHSHTFPNAPMTLLPSNDDVRADATNHSGAEPVMAKAIQHGNARKKGNSAPIRYQNPALFALFDDCDDDDFNKLVDDVIEGVIPIEEIKKRLTYSSDSEISESTRSRGCDPCD